MKLKLLVFVLAAIVLAGCGLFNRSSKKQTSRTTGWTYNDPETGNIPYIPRRQARGLSLSKGVHLRWAVLKKT